MRDLREAAALVVDGYINEALNSKFMGHMDLKDLPIGVQNHIVNTLGLRPRNVAVHVGTEAYPSNAYGDGHRAHFAIVHNAGEKPAKMVRSSWGGPNPFQTTALDAMAGSNRAYPIPPGHAVVLGSSQRHVGEVHFHPDDIAKLLPTNDATDVSDTHLAALHAHAHLKSGIYRKEALRHSGVQQEHMDDLVSRGLLSRNKAGAHTITTKGKNVLHGMRDRLKSIDLRYGY